MQITEEKIRRICVGRPDPSNMRSFLLGLRDYGHIAGLDLPHRQVPYLAQLLHESAEFRYDREVWGPTPAQERYDTRTDLGNTAARDGDGFLFRGRTPIQITGRHNTVEFRDWCRENIDPSCPDFERHPDLMNTDPWEGLGPIWYWATRRLNRWADQGDQETVTRRINGGLNGYRDRLRYYSRASLVFLGYGPEDVKKFQAEHPETGEPDGIAGPKTRAAYHTALTRLTPSEARPTVHRAPVAETQPVVPKPLDKPLQRSGGLWERLTTLLGIGGAGVAGTILQDPWIALGFLVLSACVVGVGLWQWRNILQMVREIRQELTP